MIVHFALGRACRIVRGSPPRCRHAATASRRHRRRPGRRPPSPSSRSVAEDIRPQYRFTGRIEAIYKVDLRARVDGFLEKRLFTEGADVKEGDLLFVIEKGLYQAAVDEAKAGIVTAEASLKLADIEFSRQSELVQKNVGAQARLDEATAKQGEARGDAAGAEGRAGEGAAQSQLHRHPRADRRPHRPRQRLGRQFRRPVERRAGHHRQPGSDLRRLPGDAARDSRLPQGAGSPGSPAEVVVYLQLADGSRYHASRQDQFPRRHGQPGHRHGAGARELPQSRAHAGRRPACRGRARRRQAGERAWWCRGRPAARSGRRLRAGRRQGEQGAGPPRRDRRAARHQHDRCARGSTPASA